MDQSGQLLPKPLLGHRLGERGYQELRPSGLVGGREAYYSAALGLELRSRGQGLGLALVFRDPQSGKDILVGEEMDRAYHSEQRARLAAEEAAEAERSQRLAAEEAAEAAAQTAESERSARLAAEERLAQAEEALLRGLDRAGSDLD